MRMPGAILTLATAGLTLAVIWAGDIHLTAPATTTILLGKQIILTVGAIFAVGIAAGALIAIGLVMTLKGSSRNMISHSTGRHQLRGDSHEIRDQQGKYATAAANAEADDHEGITGGR